MARVNKEDAADVAAARAREHEPTVPFKGRSAGSNKNMAKKTSNNGVAKKAKTKAAVGAPVPETKPEQGPPPRISGDDLLKDPIPLEDVLPGEVAASLPAPVEPRGGDGGDAPLPDLSGEPGVKLHLDGWELKDRCKEAGIETLERHKAVQGGTLVWISRSYFHQIAGRSIGSDAITFIPTME
jgi:hypothetical protein